MSVHVKNQGKDGDTTFDLVGRLDWAVPKGVQIVVLEFALGNDRRAGIPMERTVENVDKIVSRLVSRHIEVLLLVRGEDQEALRKRTKWFREVIDKHGISVLQIEQPVSSLLSDRQHPTAEAHGSIAASMVPPVKKLIQRVEAKPR
jgi:lysophospholipase L1-like esterase